MKSQLFGLMEHLFLEIINFVFFCFSTLCCDQGFINSSLIISYKSSKNSKCVISILSFDVSLFIKLAGSLELKS